MRHQRAVLRRWARWGALHGPRWFLRLAPVVIGLFFFVILPTSRRQLQANLRRVLGATGRSNQGRSNSRKPVAWKDHLKELYLVALTFVRFAQCLTETMAQGRSDCPQVTEVVHGETFEQLREQGRGAIVLTAHLGPWDGAARDLRQTFSGPVLLVMGQEADRASAEVQDEARRAEGIGVLRLGADPLAALPLLGHLQEGGIAAIQLDRAPAGRPAVVGMLFGRPFAAPAGPFRLAGLAQVPLIPTFVERTGFFRRRIVVGKPLSVGRRPRGKEEQAALRIVLAELQRAIERAPTQWFHFVAEPDEGESSPALPRSESVESA